MSTTILHFQAIVQMYCALVFHSRLEFFQGTIAISNVFHCFWPTIFHYSAVPPFLATSYSCKKRGK